MTEQGLVAPPEEQVARNRPVEGTNPSEASPTVFLGPGTWGRDIGRYFNAPSYSLAMLALRLPLRAPTAPRNPLVLFRKEGVSLHALRKARLLPRATRYVIYQGAEQVRNDIPEPVYEYIHESWIPPSVDQPDAWIVRSRGLAEICQSYYPRRWYGTPHHYHLPFAHDPAPIHETTGEIDKVVLTGYDKGDHHRIVGKGYWDEPFHYQREVAGIRDWFLRATLEPAFFHAENVPRSAGEYRDLLTRARLLLTFQPRTFHQISRRVLDCIEAGVCPLIDARLPGTRGYLEEIGFPFVNAMLIEEFDQLYWKPADALRDWDLDALREWKREYTYEVRAQGLAGIFREVEAEKTEEGDG